jgi:hypothetical protein
MNRINSEGKTNTFKNVFTVNSDITLDNKHSSSLILVTGAPTIVTLPNHLTAPIGWNCYIKNTSTQSILIAGLIDGSGSYTIIKQSAASFINTGAGGYRITDNLYLVQPYKKTIPATSIVDGSFTRVTVGGFADVLRTTTNDTFFASHSFETYVITTTPLNFVINFAGDAAGAGTFSWGIDYQYRNNGTILGSSILNASSALLSTGVLNQMQQISVGIPGPISGTEISVKATLTGRPAGVRALVTECYFQYSVS